MNSEETIKELAEGIDEITNDATQTRDLFIAAVACHQYEGPRGLALGLKSLRAAVKEQRLALRDFADEIDEALAALNPAAPKTEEQTP